MGLATAGLTATIVGLAVGGALAVIGVEAGPDIGLLVGILVGMVGGGWVAGRTSVHSHRFHGSVAGLLLSGILIFLASTSSADATIWNVLLLALVGIATGGFGGWMGGRRRARSDLK